MLTLAEVIILIKTYGYVLVFPIAFVEGPIIAIVCGWLVASGIFNLFLVYIILIIGNLSGDAFYYAVGYWGGTAVIKKWGHWLRLDLDKTVKLKNYFDNHGGKILLWAKIAPDLSATVILAGAGLARYNFKLFFRYGLMVEIPKTAILMLIGYFVGDAYQKIAVYFDYVGAVFSILLVILVGSMIFYYRRYSRKLASVKKQLD